MASETSQIVLIGAARSGTKILREALTAAIGAGRVPYDVPFVWYQGGRYPDSDVLDPSRLTPRTARRIRDYLDSYAQGTPPVVIEKTVGNTLRVPYVRAVLPEAVFVHLVRDGVDVTESAVRQWQEPTDVGYLREKLRHTPKRTVPSYGARYLRSAVARRRGGSVSTWGVRYPGMQRDLAADGLLRVCARQWRESVERASADLREDAGPCVEVRYEALVESPLEVLSEMVAGCGLEPAPEALAAAASSIRAGATGRGRRDLTPEERRVVQDELGSILASLGYSPADSREGVGGDGER